MNSPASDAGAAARISDAARRLLAQGSVGDEPLRRAAAVLQALPVLGADQQPHSWFVPVTVGDKLAAFLQFTLDGVLMRYSSFQRRAGDLAHCPAAADWLAPDRIRARAETQRRDDETTGTPFLSYDGTPDRLAWAVPLTRANGQTRYVYVAGQTAYAPPPAGSFG